MCIRDRLWRKCARRAQSGGGVGDGGYFGILCTKDTASEVMSVFPAVALCSLVRGCSRHYCKRPLLAVFFAWAYHNYFADPAV